MTIPCESCGHDVPAERRTMTLISMTCPNCKGTTVKPLKVEYPPIPQFDDDDDVEDVEADPAQILANLYNVESDVERLTRERDVIHAAYNKVTERNNINYLRAQKLQAEVDLLKAELEEARYDLKTANQAVRQISSLCDLAQSEQDRLHRELDALRFAQPAKENPS